MDGARRLIYLVNDVLELNIEVGATLIDQQLDDLHLRVEAEQSQAQLAIDEVQREIDRAFGRLHKPEVWQDGAKFGQVLNSLQDHFVAIVRHWRQQKRLELLDEEIENEWGRRREHAVEVNTFQATIIELTHKEVCASRNSAA